MDAGSQSTIALFPLDVVLVPGLVLPLHIFEPRYRAMLRDIRRESPESPEFGVIAADPRNTNPAHHGLAHVGTSARVTEVEQLPDGRSDITVVGQHRFQVLNVHQDRDYLTADVRWLPEDTHDAMRSSEAKILALRAARLFRDYRLLMTDVDENEGVLAGADEDPHLLSYILTAAPMLPTRTRQELLECADSMHRLARVCDILLAEIRIMRVLPSVPWPGGDEALTQS